MIVREKTNWKCRITIVHRILSFKENKIQNLLNIDVPIFKFYSIFLIASFEISIYFQFINFLHTSSVILNKCTLYAFFLDFYIMQQINFLFIYYLVIQNTQISRNYLIF